MPAMTQTLAKLRMSTPTAIAVIALVVAVFGTALRPVAAAALGQITGRDIANNAITSPKVKDGSLKSQDLHANVLSQAYWSDTDGNVALGDSHATALVVDSLNLPAGKYVVVGTTALTNITGSTQDATCVLNAGSGDVGRTRALDVAGQRSTAATVTGVFAFSSPKTVQFRCWASAASAVWTPFGSRPSITAVSVSAVHKQ
jgi:hypothetical protein